MKRRLISWMLVLCMLIPFAFTAYATEGNTDSTESIAAIRIEQIVSAYCSDSPGQYEIGAAVAIYNADMSSVYYIIPIFCNQECVGTVELDVEGNVTLTSDIALYTHITELLFPEYLLYTSGGIVYAEYLGNIIELYDSGFDILQSTDFIGLPYVDKVALAESCLETAESNLNVALVIEKIELSNIDDSEVSLYAEVPLTVAESCSITNFVTQGNYNICWAACVATIVNYKTGRNLTAVDVAVQMGHNYIPNTYPGANANQTAAAFSEYGLTYSPTSSKLSWSDVKSNINNDDPFVVGIVSPFGGHMITGYGYECRYRDSYMDSDWRYVSVWDPNGQHLLLQYNATSYSIYGYSWNWIETLIV